MAPPEPPLIANLLSYILLLGLVYLLLYAIQLRQKKEPELPLTNNSENVSEVRQNPAPLELFIEPSPLPGQNIHYPTLAEAPAELDLSIVIPVRNPGPAITDILQQFITHFSERPNFRYEILVVDLFSRDTTRTDCIQFAQDHKVVRVMHIPMRCLMSTGVILSLLRTRGKWVYLYNLLDKLPIEVFDIYESKMVHSVNQGKHVLVCGSWAEPKEPVDNELFTRSTLNIVMEWLEHWLLGFLLKDEICHHARTFLMTREAADIIGSTLHIPEERYDLELLIIAAKTKMVMKTAKLEFEDRYKSSLVSWQRIDSVVEIIVGIFMYYTRGWRIYRSI